MKNSNRTVLLAVVLIASFGVLPLIVYWVWVGHARSVSPRDALAMLNTPGTEAVLVDVRDIDVYRASHIQGAVNWPLDQITTVTSADEIPAALKRRPLLLICDNGISSSWAADRLNRLPEGNAYSVDGGMQVWTIDAATSSSAQFASLVTAGGTTAPLPTRTSTPLEQMAAFLGGFWIKTLYMLLSLALFIALWRKPAVDLAAVGWSMGFFFLGELLCWINFPIMRTESPLLEYGHSFGMVLCLSFLMYGAVRGMDERILHFSDPKGKCALVELCGGCEKYRAVPCGLTRMLRMLIVVLILVTPMLFTVTPQMISYNSRVFGLIVNYTHPMLNQLYEVRFSPIAAIALLLAAFVALSLNTRRENPWPVILLSGGIAFLMFGIMRSLLFAFYRDNLVWFAFWEEATELVLVAGIGYVVWVFRARLGVLPQLDRWQSALRSWLS